MSYASCVNSALINPSGFIDGAVGFSFEPGINVNPVASAALLQPMAAYTLPKGLWLVSGTLYVDGAVATETVEGNTGIAIDATVVWRSQNADAPVDGLSVLLSAVVSSDGTNVLTIPMTYTTSGGGDYGVSAAPLSVIQVTKIA